MIDFLHSPAGACALAVAYLALVQVLLLTVKRVPAWVHLVAAIGAQPYRLWALGGIETAVTVVGAIVLFVALVALAGRTASGTSVFAIATTLAVAPFSVWPGVALGLVLAGLVAGWRVYRSMGKDRVQWLAISTLESVGVSPSGTFVRPDRNLLLQRGEDSDTVEGSDDAEVASPRLPMYLPPFLAIGLAVAGVLAF